MRNKTLTKITLAIATVFAVFVSCKKSNDSKSIVFGKQAITINAEEYKGKDYVDPTTGWSKYDNLIAAIKSESDYAKRAKLMHEAEDILMSNWCIIPIYYYNDMYLQKSYVTGIYTNAFADKFFHHAKLSNGSKTLRVNIASEPDYLDPALNSSVDGSCLAIASFEGLYSYNENGKIVPALAEGCTISDDGITYTVKLKKNLKWSDGTPLTAEDFAYSWKRAADPQTAADYGYMFDVFEGYDKGSINVKALDADTLQFKLNAPCAYMENLMAFTTFLPVKKEAVESNKNWKTSPGGWCQEAGFVSNGPFVCSAWKHDTSMTYTKNPYYWDAANVTIDKIEFMLSADDNAIFAAYNSGDLDFADTVPSDAVSQLISTKDPEFHTVDKIGTYYAAFNSKSHLFEGKTPAQAACMREAISILIDRDYICENIAQTGQVPANAFIPIGMSDGNGGLFKSSATEQGYFNPYAIDNDLEGTVSKAISLLRAAGYRFNADGRLSAETPISITYLTNTNSAHIATAEAIQQDLAIIGINLTIQERDWNVFLEERKKGNFDFAREGWIADFDDPINMLEMWTSTSGNNDCQFGK